ncbi:unnamed protein product [Onchocerca flexuosa]|uniref:Ovule protein n=1 Tax=Onchocerca flexuosa TaxID=387005 RepID=A0A183I2Y7_9BILA|nr:unnamed protein product [Onchocerca flexuosa]
MQFAFGDRPTHFKSQIGKMQGHLKLLFKKGPLTLGDMKMKPVNIVKTEQQECGSSSKIRHQRMLSFIDKNYERTLVT